MQAVRFYYTYVREWRPKQFGLVQAPTFSDDTHPANFVGRQLAHYIKKMSLHRGQLLLPGHERGLSKMWSSYASTMLEIIELINFFIRGGTFNGRNYIYSCLFTLMRLDLPAHWSLWHARIRGCIALYPSVIHNDAGKDANHRLQQLHGRQMRIILLGEYDCDMPAPLDLRIAIFHINQLRFETATKPLTDLTPLVHRQLDKIDVADIEAWSRQNAVYGVTHSLALARIFHLAVRLFALLTLPRSATTSWAHARMPGPDPYDNLCLAQRAELLVRMRALFPQLEYQPNLRWPMVVAGVAAAHGAAEDREFVARSLRAIWEQPVVACGPMRCREMLMRLWRSGGTEWEDCFVEPVPC